MTKVKSPLGRL